MTPPSSGTDPDPEPEKKYTVTFVYDDGTTADLTKEVVKDSNVEKPTDPTREGYVFKGWYIANETEEKEFKFTTPITENLELKAKWAKVHTVTFDLNGGTSAAIADQMVVEGEKATAPTPEPTRGGYAFKGWYKEGATAAFDFINSPVTENIELKAKWVEVHTVTFNLNGGTVAQEIGPQTVEYGDYAKVPTTIPTKDDCNFLGWYADLADTKAFNFEKTVITENLTLIAKWQISVYSVVFKENYGLNATFDDGSVDRDGKITDPTMDSDSPTRPGYEFKWWSSSDDGSTGRFDFNTPINDDVAPSGTLELYAIWTQLFMVNADGVLTPTTEGKALANVVIPKTVDGNTVKQICANAFAGCSGITSVTFGTDSELTTIGESAFQNCTNMTSFEIPASVTTIGNSAFSGCNNITSVSFGTGSRLDTIGGSAFYNCTKMTSFDIPASVTTIGYSAFSQCTGLTSIAIPSKVEKVNQYAFQNCKELQRVRIESLKAEYETGIFCDCKKMNSVDFPTGMESKISVRMFYNCEKLVGEIRIPKGVPSIEKDAFYGTNLTKARVYSGTSVDTASFPSSCTVEFYSE